MDVTDMIFIALKLVAVAFLVLLNGFFVAAEFAIVKIRDTQLIPLVRKGDRRAKMARHVVGNLDASLSATQLGITLASLGLGWIGEPVFSDLLAPLLNLFGIHSENVRHSISFAVGFSVITFLHIVVGELAPKSMAIQKPLPTSLWVARPLHWFYKLSFPFIYVLNNTSLWLLRKVGIVPVSEAELAHSEEELRLLIGGGRAGAGETDFSRSLVLNAFDLRRRVAREVMQPRTGIVALDTESTMAECLDVAEKTRYSRFPLCEGGDLDQALGVVHFKDLYAMRMKGISGRDLLPVSRKIIYIPETARLERLLQLFLERRLHLALVVDEFGGTVGMVTLENILEELVGQIQDEFDQEKPMLETVKEGEWVVAGNLPLHDLEALVAESLTTEDVSTVSGWITHKLGAFPSVGDEVQVGQYRIVVEGVEGAKVDRLRVLQASSSPEI